MKNVEIYQTLNMTKSKGKYYQYTKPGNPAIVLCTENSDSHVFTGVCVRPGIKLKVAHYSCNWTSDLFTETKYNEMSLEEKINDKLLESKKKLITFEEDSNKFKCLESTIQILENLLK